MSNTAQVSGTLPEVLSKLVQDTKGGNTGYLSDADAALLGGYAELAPHLRDPQGRAAARASKSGVEFLATLAQPLPAATPAPSSAPKFKMVPIFAVETGFGAPVSSIRGTGSKYPFAQMQAPRTNPETGKLEYDTFFIAATPESPNPHKAIIGSVSSVNKRDTSKKFASRKVEGGARVWRMK